jgi:hypothetical protein
MGEYFGGNLSRAETRCGLAVVDEIWLKLALAITGNVCLHFPEARFEVL